MSVLSEQLDRLWSSTPEPEAVFRFLRNAPRSVLLEVPSADSALQSSIDRIFSGSHELFTKSYAQSLRVHGAEPQWLNDLALTIAVSSGAPAVRSRVARPGQSALTARAAIPPGTPVMAFWIRGRTERRALVISGVHGSEQSGIEVVERLHRDLTAPGAAPPRFTTILVPVLFPDNLEFDRQYRRTATSPVVRGTNGSNDDNGRYVRVADPLRRPPMVLVEPNRNYPLPGESGDDARRRGLRNPSTGLPLSGPHIIDHMLPETAGLVTLIEMFRPERIASVHAHRSSTRRGDAQGIFVDPRGGVQRNAQGIATQTLTPEGQADDALTRAMRDHARSLGGRGLNPQDDLHYSEAPGIHPEGTSLGGWAPVAESRAGGRPAATMITLEVENYWPSTEDPAVALRVGVYARTLQEIFLENPSP